MTDSDIEWIDDTIDILDFKGPSRPPFSMDDEWDEIYPSGSDIDDGWELFSKEEKLPVQRFQKTIKVRKVPDSVFRSIETVIDYTHELGREAVLTFEPIFDSETYASLSSAQRARILRYRFAPSVTKAWDKSAGVSQTVMTDVLKGKGIVVSSPRALVMPALNRFKSIVARTVDFDVVDGDFEKGWSTLDGGSSNIVDMAPRQTLLQASELVDDLTGTTLRARRFTQSPTACDYCRMMAKKGFEVSAYGKSRDFLSFHDNCRCSVEVL